MKKFYWQSIVLFFLGIAIAVDYFYEQATQKQSTASTSAIAFVNVYTSLNEMHLQPLWDDFTEKTGVLVQVQEYQPQRIVKKVAGQWRVDEGDVVLLEDARYLVEAAKKLAIKPISSEALRARVPPSLRSELGDWYAVGVYHQPIYYRKEGVQSDQLSGYLELADPKWQGKLLMLSPKKDQNVSLIAWMISRYGVSKATEWIEGLASNVKQLEKSNGSNMLLSLANGEGDIALVDYGAYHEFAQANSALAEKIGVYYPEAAEATYANIVGAALVTSTRRSDNAIKLLKFLVSDSSQVYLNNVFGLLPVVRQVGLNRQLKTPAKIEKIKKEDIQGYLKYDPIARSMGQKFGW